MAHDCSPNTNRFYDAGVMTLVATQPVPAGARVTTSYTSLLWGGEARRAHLAATKFFLCTCRRCQDPSEFGTDVTALACRGGEGATGGSCGGRRVCRRHGEDLCWRCTRCEKSMTAAEVHTLHQVLALTLGRTLALRDAAKAEAWLEAHQGVLSGESLLPVGGGEALERDTLSPATLAADANARDTCMAWAAPAR
ncbi:SET domain-containing protein SmydA-8-like [Pollicipes pollicipes]|uniref:SET domain-containing protein SmydA-8-like n=1 Tax=Pollicipes pollicipes TaxID=41117 RepID=UPI001884E8ED|nr:SET domain-containing protein SmydA-8-like [Pollicipes pollicipes]